MPVNVGLWLSLKLPDDSVIPKARFFYERAEGSRCDRIFGSGRSLIPAERRLRSGDRQKRIEFQIEPLLNLGMERSIRTPRSRGAQDAAG